MIAYCGLTCTDCPAYLATKNNDDALRAETAAKWSKLFKAEIAPEEIACHGCLSEGGSLFSHCHVCAIRKCGQIKGVENCAHCNEYPCAQLSEFHETVAEAKRVLDDIRRRLEG